MVHRKKMKENEKRQISGSYQRAENIVKYKGYGENNTKLVPFEQSPKGLVKRLGELEISGKTETMQTTALLESAS